MGVLPAVLPDSRQIAPDIAWVLTPAREGGGKQLDELVLPVEKLLYGRVYRLCAPLSACQHREGLRNGVNGALVVLLGTQGRSVVVIAPAVPGPVPGVFCGVQAAAPDVFVLRVLLQHRVRPP